MSYWKVDGYTVDGSESNSTAGFEIIPNNTTVTAEIKSIDEKEFGGSKYYSVSWEVVGEEYRGSKFFQSVRVNDISEAKRAKAKNMLLRLMLLCGRTAPEMKPERQDFINMFNKPLQVLVMVMKGEEKSFNYVKSVNKLSDESSRVGGDVSNNTSVEAHKKADEFNDDIPF